MKHILKLGLVGLILFVSMGGTYAQTPPSSLNTYAPPPNPVSQVTAAVVGNPGSGTFYYWVVPIYPIGKGAATSVIVRNTPNIFTLTNYVQINWPFTSGASGYDVLRTTTPSLPSTCTCAIALATAATSLNDTGLPGLAYTISTASGTSGYIRLNNQSYPTPRYDITPPINLSPSTFTGVLPVANGGTGSTGLTGAVVGTGSIYNGVVGNPLQIFRRQANLPINGYEFTNQPVIYTSYYNFPPQTPRVVLSLGVPAVVRMAPCPLGVNGSDINHYLYISGGIGIAEPVLITGGTCTSGAASGTIGFTPNQNHSGAYTIQSGSTGLYESIIANATNGNATRIRVSNNTFLYNTVTMPPLIGADIILEGDGTIANTIIRHSSFTIGSMLVVDNQNIVGDPSFPGFSTALIVRDMLLVNGSTGGGGIFPVSGAAIDIRNSLFPRHLIDNCTILNGVDGIIVKDAISFVINNNFIFEEATYAASGHQMVTGITLTGVSARRPPGGFITKNRIESQDLTSASMLAYAIFITGSDGTILDENYLVSFIPIRIEGALNRQIGGVYIHNSILDSPFSNGILILGDTTTGGCASCIFQAIRIANNHIGNGQSTTTDGIRIADGTNADYIQILGNNIFGFGQAGIRVGAEVSARKAVMVSNNTIFNINNSNTANIASIQLAADTHGFSAVGNVAFNNAATGHAKFGIRAEGNLSDSLIVGNILTPNDAAGAAVSIVGAVVNVTNANNQ